MSMQQERPPAYAQHEPESLHLPEVPRHEPPSISHGTRHLPGIKSLDLPNATPRTLNATLPPAPFDLNQKPHNDAQQWHYVSPLSHTTFPQVPTTVPRTSAEMEIGSPMDTSSIVSAEEYQSRRAPSVVSVDDPDVRLAAEALSGLGNPDFARSPTSRSLTAPRERPADPEPLLNLITSNHPWVGGTINGSISAYNATKSYSPRFVKYGAELIERNIGSPVVNTVSSVGRRTGVERNIRRYLGEVGRRPSDLEQGDPAEHKRRRVASPTKDEMMYEDSNPSPRTRVGSQISMTETLPAYDDHRSPQYEETSSEVAEQNKSEQSLATQERRPNWSTQLIMTTSGLGVALSESSLKSLKACLSLLRSATTHIDNVMQALRALLEEYENAMGARQQSDGQGAGPMDSSSTYQNMPPEKEDQVRTIAEKMKNLGNDIMSTLQKVVASVSRYTGGTLPQNASQVVRTQLLSVPQRWRVANRVSAENSRGAEVQGANKMLAFAKEGLDMMAQISTVIDGTVQSAESWLDRMGKRRVEEDNAQAPPSEKDKPMEGITYHPVDEKREKY